MSRSLPIVLAVLSLLAVGLMIGPQPGHAQERATVEGRVVNGTAGAPLSNQGLQVTLHVLRQIEQVAVLRSEVDADGAFRFDEVPVGDDLLYLAVAEYQGVAYRTVAQGELPSQLEIMVYESTSSLEEVRVADSALIATGADADQRTLLVFERLTLVNAGDRTFVPDLERPQNMNFLRFSLPQDVQDLQVSGDLQGGQLLTVDRGFALTAPVPPGEYELAFTYAVPYSRSSLNFTRSFPLETEVFRVLMPQKLGLLGTQGLAAADTVSIAGQAYYLVEGHDLTQGARISIQIRNLPEPSLVKRVWRSFTQGRSATVLLVVLIALALLGVLAWGMAGRFRGRQAAPVKGVDLQGVRADRESQVLAIARLDTRFEQNQLAEARYRQERQALKLRILRLMALERIEGGST